MRRILRALNALPWNMGINHYFPLRDMSLGEDEISLVKSKGWDLLRATGGQFFIPDDREQWVEMCNTPIVHDSNSGDLAERARSVVKFLSDYEIGGSLFSVGVGLAALEHHIQKISPNISLYCSDYGDETVARLRKVFLECKDIRKYDLVNDNISEVFPESGAGDLLLIHRVDPHLSDLEWREVFNSLSRCGIENILFVPHRVLDLRYIKYSKLQELVHRIKGTTLAFSGRVRTLKLWMRIWSDSYSVVARVEIGYSGAFYLRSKSRDTK